MDFSAATASSLRCLSASVMTCCPEEEVEVSSAAAALRPSMAAPSVPRPLRALAERREAPGPPSGWRELRSWVSEVVEVEVEVEVVEAGKVRRRRRGGRKKNVEVGKKNSFPPSLSIYLDRVGHVRGQLLGALKVARPGVGCCW